MSMQKRVLLGIVFGLCALFSNTTQASTEMFTRNLRQGDTGADVLRLQVMLNTDPVTRITSTGPGSPGNETMYFGALTTDAVRRFQELYRNEILIPAGLSMGTGFFGVSTRAQANKAVSTDQNNVTDESPHKPASPTLQAKQYGSPEKLFDALFSGNFVSGPVPSIKEQRDSFNGGSSIPGGPALVSVTPESGPDGTRVTIVGTGFTDANIIYGNAKPIEGVVSSDGKTLTFIARSYFPEELELPPFFSDLVPYIMHPVFVKNKNGRSNALPFFLTY